MSATPDCPGFKAHAINPSRCRRCFKDLSDHGTSGTENAANSQTLSGVNTRRATRTPSFSGESARRGEQSTGSINAPRRSQSLRSLEEVSGGTSSEMSSPSASQSVSYTLKPKRVKFCDESSTIEEEDGCKAESEHASAPVNVEFTVHVKKPRGSLVENSKNYEDYQSRIKELSQELSKAKEKIDILQTKNKELENMRTTFGKVESKEGIKHNFDENIKLKQKIDDLEQTVRTLKSDKRSLEERLKQGSTLASTNRGAETEEVIELRTKLAESQKVIAQLTQENDEIKKDVKELEVEFQELHDNFREDQSSEFRVIKRELEAMSKNCRVMQFKLKKSERTIEQLENEKIDLQKQVSDLYETSRMDVDKRRMKELENELSIAKEVSLKLHAEMNALRDEHTITLEQLQESQRKQTEKPNARAPSLGTGLGKLSPTPSLDQSSKDYEQVVRDLYDTMEREKDIQEQLKFSEEETRTMRKKLSTMEQENEILMMQIRKMATKSNSGKEEEDESEELNPEEMKLHLELYEQEMIVLRRKTDELEQENENFQQEIKYLQEKLVSQPLTKVEIPEIPASSPPNVIYDHKIRILETEARELRKKLVDKEKENESLRTEVELHRRRASKVINRSRSLDSEGQSLDMKKQLQLFEQEANILRQKMVMMENDNEKLTNENKRLQLRISKKPPPGPVDQLQIENMELKDKVRELERRCDSLKTDLMNAKLNETTETETDFIANLKKQLRTKETDLSNQASKMAKMDIEYTRINREYKKLKESLVPRRKVNRVIRETATRLELKEIIKEMEEEVEHLQITNRGKDAILENLTEEVSELKRECQELEQKQSTAKNSAVPGELLDLKKKLEEEQHRCKSLQEKLEKLSKTKKVDLDSFDTIEVLKAEKKELAIQVEDLMLDLQKSKSRAEDMEGKLKVFTRNKDDLNSNNVQLRESLDKSEEVIEELSKKLKTSETKEKEVRKKYEEAKQEMERVSNVNQQLKREVDENRNKLAAINSRSGDVSEKSALQQRECEDLKRKLNESNKRIASLQAQLERQQSEFRDKEDKMRDELNEQLEANSKKVRREVHLELQSLREESTNYKNRCNEVLVKLEKTEKELKEANDKIKTHNAQVRRDREELQERIDSLENQLKSEQRKRDKLEREIENTTRGKEEDLLQAQEKIVQLERDIRRHQARLEDQEYDYNGRLNASDRELNKIKQDYEDLTSKYEMLEKDFVDLKSRAVAEKDTLVEAVSSLKKSYEEKLSEIKTLKESSMSQRKEWYQQKLSYQERVADLESKLNKANLVEEERNRLKILVSEKENLLNSYRKEEKMHNEERERNRIKTEELQNRLTELECIERNTRFLSITGRAQVDKELQNYRIRLEHSETSHKGELAALHAEYEGRMRLLGEEVEHMQQQMAMLAQERDRYRESLDKAAKDMNARGSLRGTLRDEIEDLNSQLRTLRSDLEGALLENRNLKIQHGTERTTWQIQLAECKTQINQMEERILLETRGSTRNYARTKMELAWEKERQENHRLLQETQKFIQELRDKLLGTEGLREKERDEARKQLLELKNGMDREHVETQQKISELQFDLLALKEAHARLKSQNERLRRERAAFEKARIDFVNEEMVELQKIVEGAPKAVVGTAKSASVIEAIGQLQNRLKSRLNELMQEAAARGVSSSDLSIVSKLNGRLTGSNTSLSSTNLPPPSAIKRAPPRAMKLAKKSLSLDQQLSNSAMRGASQERIWESDRESLQSTPNSSVTNLRLAPRYGYAGYESDSSGSSFFLPSGALRLRTGFTKEGSFAGGSESDTSCASGQQAKKSLKEKLKIRKTSKTESVSEDEAGRALKQKLALQGFELSPIELAKQREKKEKSLRYKISKTLSKTFSRSTSVLPEATGDSSSNQAKTSSKTRSKSPSRTKSPTRFTQEFKQKSESISTSQARPTLGQTKVVSQVPGIDQLRQRPRQSNLAIPPSRRSPPKTRPRTETNV